MPRLPSTRAHDQVLEAALRLFAERGIDATSMDAIAETSGVSKATIYKHWPDKDALCIEVLAHLHGMRSELPVFNTGDIRADIIALLSHRRSEQRSELKNRMMPHLMAYASRNPAFAKAWRSLVIDPPRHQLKQLLKRAVAKGQLRADLDYDLAAAMLLGPMMYRHVMLSMNAKTTNAKRVDEMPRQIVAAFWDAYAPKRPRNSSCPRPPSAFE
ncbi:MAG TPA: TetR/AcrR family transcriptional regulator [Bryobacteraceae bacterium]|nr:TetR/AcrR family transcriptional regulator [Bryobacteraceae bacterium]